MSIPKVSPETIRRYCKFPALPPPTPKNHPIIPRPPRKDKAGLLSKRVLQLLELWVIYDLTALEIAHLLDISASTVNNQIQGVYDIIGNKCQHSKLSLGRWLVWHGYFTKEDFLTGKKLNPSELKAWTPYSRVSDQK